MILPYFLSNLGMGGGGSIAPTGPATLREAIRYRLGDVPGLSAIVGTDVYFGSYPQTANRPCVTFTVASRTFDRVFAGTHPSSRARININCWSDDEAEAADMADKIRLYFDGFQGMIGDQFEAFYIALQNEIDMPVPKGNGTDDMVFRVLLDFSVTHKVAVGVPT